MLDTRMPPVSPRTRRSYTSAQPAPASRLQARGQTVREQAVRVQTAREQDAPEPARRSLPSTRTSRLARSDMRMMSLAIASTAAVCALLLLYLAAYAHVTQLGIAQSQARTQLHDNQIRNALLQAQRNALESPQRIEAAAAAQGMTPRGAAPVNYIAAQTASAQTALAQTVQTQPDGDQGIKSDTTENSGAAASGSH